MNQTWKIIVAVIITAVVVGGGFYFWQQSKEETPQVTRKTEDQTPAPAAETEKTFTGSGFTFTYPVEYTADNKGLWTTDGYQRHINPPEACDTCQIPEVEVKATTSNKTLDQQIIADYDLPGTTLAEMSKQTGIKYEQIKIGDNDFIKITVSDMFDVTGYYTKHNNQIVAFKVYLTEKDNKALKDIISTLKFN